MFSFKTSHLATPVAAMARGLASSAVLAKGGDSGRGRGVDDAPGHVRHSGLDDLAMQVGS